MERGGRKILYIQVCWYSSNTPKRLKRESEAYEVNKFWNTEKLELSDATAQELNMEHTKIAISDISI